MFLGLLILIVFAVAFVWQPFAAWWNNRQDANRQLAELEAASMITHPVLIRSRYPGDTTVEQAAEQLRDNLKMAGRTWITPEDVHVAIYRTRTMDGNLYIAFQDWSDMQEQQHRQRCLAWETAKETEMKTNGQSVGLSANGKRTWNGQHQPKPTQRTIKLEVN